MNNQTLHLFCYHVWANTRMLNHLRTLPDEAFTKPLDSVFPSVRETWRHILEVDRIWFGRVRKSLQGDSAERSTGAKEGTDPDPLEDAANALRAFEALYRDIERFLEQLEDERATVEYANSRGETFRNTVEEIVRHVVNHGTYHRGNVTAMLRQMGYSGVSTDYIYFLRDPS